MRNSPCSGLIDFRSLGFLTLLSVVLTGCSAVRTSGSGSGSNLSLAKPAVVKPDAGRTGLPFRKTSYLWPTRVSFGTQTVGTSSAPQAVVFSNINREAVKISAIIASGDFAQSNDCAAMLAPALSV
jgi:hypothetical protein